MDVLANILAIAKPTGVWPSIINTFESGVGSYILAIVLITIIIRIILSPFDTVNKKISKKQAEAQARLQPQLEKIQKQYGNDKNLVNQKTQELYKKEGLGLGGSCLFMIVFMAINLTIFFTLFSSLNAMADYKINQQYLTIKDSYSNVLNLYKECETAGQGEILSNYENLTVVFSEDKVKFVNKENNETVYFETEYKNDFSVYQIQLNSLSPGNITDKIEKYDQNNEYTKVKIETGEGEEKVVSYYYILTEGITKNENEEGVVTYTIETEHYLYDYVTSDQVIKELILTYIEKEEVAEGETSEYSYIGDTVVKSTEEGDVTLSTALHTLAFNEAVKAYEGTLSENSLLWIGSIWVADSPFKNSVFTYDEYVNEIGSSNVSSEEKVIYNSFMNDLREQKGRVNGYFILAIISIGISFLATWLGQRGTQKVNAQGKKSGWLMMVIMPLIMGIFAILYNSVFAIYLVVSQAISALLTPLSNYLVKIWCAHDQKKAEQKAPKVDYRRK